MQSSLDRFIRKRQAPADSNCGEEGKYQEKEACVIVNNFKHLDPLILWQRMFTAFKDHFPNILRLLEIILILPLATATVERGFSAMKRVKNDWRSCLKTDILNMLLRITINGCSKWLEPRGNM